MEIICKIRDYISRPEIAIWIIVLVIYALSKYGLRLEYLSVIDIVKRHTDCFRNSKTKKIRIIPIINYFIVPFMLGASAATIKTIDGDVVNIVTIIVSIFTSMLFTLLAMLIDMKSKIEDNTRYSKTETEISKMSLIETYYAVMFEILVSIVLLVLCFFNVFTSKFDYFQSFLIYSLTFLLIINLLMVIKRIFRAIDSNMRK